MGSKGAVEKTPDYFSDLKTPDPHEMELQLQQLVQQGVISPEDAQAQLAGRSELDNIQTDPALKQAQMDALLGLQDISSNGGLTAADKANLNKIHTDEDTAAKGKRDAILQNAQARGISGSGLELLDQLTNAQSSATRNSQRDMDVAGQAQDRALQALIQGGQLGGQIQNQSFNQQAQQAGANDAISKFNAANQQQVNLANTQAHNQAQEANLANSQNIANQNVGLANQQQQYNKNLIQQQYDNEIKKRSGSAGIAANNTAAQNAANQANAGMTNNLIGSVIGAGASIYGAKGKKDGGLITDGTDGQTDNVPTFLAKGELVIPAKEVPHALQKIHTNEKGEFDAGGFLDMITGKKIYGKGKK